MNCSPFPPIAINIMQRFLYNIGFGLVWMLSRLPLALLYIISDIFYFIVRYLVRYRLRVVRRNVERSFPEKTPEERSRIINGFYHYFCDYGVETLKLMTMSEADIRRRMNFTNIPEVEALFRDHDFIFIYLGHYGNWEWVSSLGIWFSEGIYPCQLYKPIRNGFLNQLFLKLRYHFHSHNIDKNLVLREILRLKSEGKKVICGFISDQSPKVVDIHVWVDFLHQDTPCFTGAERIGKKLNAAFFYLDVQRKSRGHYEATFELMSCNSRQIPDWQLTADFMQRLEKTIRRQPEIWLWSHKRWKHQRT